MSGMFNNDCTCSAGYGERHAHDCGVRRAARQPAATYCAACRVDTGECPDCGTTLVGERDA